VADVPDGRGRTDVRAGEFFLSLAGESSLCHRAFPQRSAAALQRLDKELGRREYLAGEYSIADIATYPWVWRHEIHEVKLEDFPNVKRWFDAIAARPAVKRGMEIPKG
jgi:GST-like protein